MEKRPFFRAAISGLGTYHMGGYGRIGVYRVISVFKTFADHSLIYKMMTEYLLATKYPPS